MYASPSCKYSDFGLIEEKLVQTALLIFLCKIRALKNSQLSFLIPCLCQIIFLRFGTPLKLLAAMAGGGVAADGRLGLFALLWRGR